MNQQPKIIKKNLLKLLKTSLASTMVAISHLAGAQTATPIVVQTISSLQSLNTTGFTNDTVAYVIDYYGLSYNAARGGGHFRWISNNIPTWNFTNDGGRFIVSASGNTNGIWERVLDGGMANVKMWGAYGDGVHDDTAAIQAAINGVQDWSSGGYPTIGMLSFPAGTYLITNTLIFNPTLTHITGDGPMNTTVMMTYGVNADIFHCNNADNWINHHTGDMDHGLVFENLSLYFQAGNTNNPPARNTSNAALVLVPGEVSTIRNVHTKYGAIGIRSLGGGAPGLSIRDCKTDDCLKGISIEPVPGSTSGSGGPITIDRLSGDQILSDIAPNASLVVISNVATTTDISGIKAESDWGGGLIHYYSAANGENLESVTMRNCAYNAGAIPGQTWYTPDFLVIDSTSGYDGYGPMFTLDQIKIYGIPNLIRDNIGNRIVESDTEISQNGQLATPLQMVYQANWTGGGYPTNELTGSGLFIGQNAVTTFWATNAGWYRIMSCYGTGNGNLGGRVSITSPYALESIELEVDCTQNHLPAINVNRCKVGPLVISQARAITYSDPLLSGEWSFVDVYVTNALPSTSYYNGLKYGRLTVTLDTAGVTPLNVMQPELLAPVLYGVTVPSGASVTTVNTYR